MLRVKSYFNEREVKKRVAQTRLYETAILTSDLLDRHHVNTGWSTDEFYHLLNEARKQFGDPEISRKDNGDYLRALVKKHLLYSHERFHDLQPQYRLTPEGEEEAKRIWSRLDMPEL